VKWACTLAAVMLAACCVASGWYSVGIQRVLFVYPHGSPVPTLEGLYLEWGRIKAWVSEQGAAIANASNAEVICIRTGTPSWEWKFERHLGGTSDVYIVPLWAPSFIAAIAAGDLWYTDVRDRRSRRLGVCSSCGYSRAGLAGDAPCPACDAIPMVPAPTK
jgi:hypothetical protein